MGKCRIAEVIEQYAVAVGEDDGIAGAGQLLVEVGHFDLGHRLHVGQPILALAQVGGRHHFGIVAGSGIELVFVQTSDPGACDPIGNGSIEHGAAGRRGRYQVERTVRWGF